MDQILNGFVTKNRVLPVTTLFFWKFCFSLRTSYIDFFYHFNFNRSFLFSLARFIQSQTLFNRNIIVVEMDFSSFSSAWEFFDTNSMPNFLRLPIVNSSPFRWRRKSQFLKLLRGQGSTLDLPEINKTRS